MAAVSAGALTAWVVVVIGASSPAVRRKAGAGTALVSVSAGSTLGVDVSAGTAVCDCASGDCVINVGAFIKVGPSSESMDVNVFVRYNAVRSNIIGNRRFPNPHVVTALQFHTPKSGNKSSTGPLSPGY